MNPDERGAYEWLGARGMTVLRRGWPDFLVRTPHGWIALELKSGAKRRLTADQVRMQRALKECGVETATILWAAGAPRRLLQVEQLGRLIDVTDPGVILRRGARADSHSDPSAGSARVRIRTGEDADEA